MKRKMNLKQAIAFVGVSLLCIAPIVMGIVLLIKGWILNLAFAVCFLILPVAVIAVAYLAIKSSSNIWSKLIMCAAAIWIGTSLFLFLQNNCCFEGLMSATGEKAEARYSQQDLIHEKMPSLDEIGNPVNLEYYNYFTSENAHGWNSNTLIATYSELEYMQQKNLLEEKNDFLDMLRMAYDGDMYSASCRIRDYAFRIVNTGTETGAPHSIMFIACNDRIQEIVYLSFEHCCSAEIRTLDMFLKKDCGWEHIR